MLERLTVRNYRTFRDVTIDFKPLTVIMGENRVGKTTLLRILSSMRNGGYPDADHWTSPEFYLEGSVNRRNFRFRYGYLFDNHSGLRKFDARATYDPLTEDDIDIPDPMDQEFDPTDDFLALIGTSTTVLYDSYEPDDPSEETRGYVRHFGQHHPDSLLDDISSRNDVQYNLVDDLIERTMVGYYLVPVSRTVTSRKTNLDPKQAGAQQLAFTEQHLYSSLMYDTDRRSKASELLQEILGARVDMSLGRDNKVSAQAKRGERNVNIADDGSSIHSLLYVLAQLVFVPPYSTVMIDEPEISLSPARQKRMFEVVGRYAAENAIQLIMATHSIPIILRALKGVKEGGVSVLEMKLDNGSTSVGAVDNDSYIKYVSDNCDGL